MGYCMHVHVCCSSLYWVGQILDTSYVSQGLYMCVQGLCGYKVSSYVFVPECLSIYPSKLYCIQGVLS